MPATCEVCGQQYNPLIGSPGGYSGHSCPGPEAEVFSRDECVWYYCPHPEDCQQTCAVASSREQK